MHVVLHYAEVALKGRNRPRFEERLLRNAADALRGLAEPRLRRLYGRLLIEVPDSTDFEALGRRLARVYGIAYFARATLAEPTFEAIEQAVDAFTEGRTFRTFGVRARRPEKRHPFTSAELSVRLGRHVERRTGARVDLESPDLWIRVDVLANEAILLHDRMPGPGGMPVGTAGPVVALISGGIDSPVAAALALKRGCELCFAHFHSAPYTSSASQDKVRELVGRLAASNGPSRLYLIPFAELQQTLVRETPAQPRIVLYRRFMLRVAERLGARTRARALVTGESLSQVSSQTLANLDSINRAATLPVLRPLIGMDKDEIVRRARELGTYEISIEPDEDCCSYLMPRRPATWTEPEAIEQVERALDAKGLVEAILERTVEERIEPTHA